MPLCYSTSYETEITKLYFINKYEIHDIGVELWAESESGEELGIFVEHPNVYHCDEEVSRIIALYDQYGNPKEYYLYFNKEDFKEYLQYRYNIS